MSKYTVRPYYGHDCDSESGFNNGHYLDPIEVDAESEEQACDAAMAAWIEANHPNGLPKTVEVDGHLGDWTLYEAYDFVNKNGESLTEEQFCALDDPDGGGYLYWYIDFSAVESTT